MRKIKVSLGGEAIRVGGFPGLGCGKLRRTMQTIDATWTTIAGLEFEDRQERLECRALFVRLETSRDFGADRGKTKLAAQRFDACLNDS